MQHHHRGQVSIEAVIVATALFVVAAAAMGTIVYRNATSRATEPNAATSLQIENVQIVTRAATRYDASVAAWYTGLTSDPTQYTYVVTPPSPPATGTTSWTPTGNKLPVTFTLAAAPQTRGNDIELNMLYTLTYPGGKSAYGTPTTTSTGTASVHLQTTAPGTCTANLVAPTPLASGQSAVATCLAQ